MYNLAVHKNMKHFFKYAYQFLACLAHEILPVELGGHGAPHLCTLNPSYEPTLLQLQPVGFIQFWSNKKVEISNFIVLTKQSRSETKLTVRLYDC
jgi:hypothetical protein